MAQRIKISLSAINADALDKALKTALTVEVCPGIVVDRDGIFILLDEFATPAQVAQAQAIATAHDPALLTTEQQEEVQGAANVDDLLSKIDTAVADLTAKRAAFNTAPTLLNAAPLLLEISQDLIGVLKAVKYIAKRIP